MSPSLRKVVEDARERMLRARDERARRRAQVGRREGAAATAWRRFRRGTDRYRLLTDVVGGLLLVAVVIGGIAAATGGVWPPVVIVESGSMMHPVQETPYGRFGTIDVGDMVFIRAVDGPEDVTTWADGGKLRYGRPGDVIAYAPNGNHSATPVIHRAIAFVEVHRDERAVRTYTLHWIDGKRIEYGPEGIYFPPLGFSDDWGFTPTNGYRPGYSGYITKGDNAFTNPAADQAMPNRATPVSALVEPAWILGEVYGEVPWIGLAKLALQSGQTNPQVPGWERVGNAFAPLELWTMFFLVLSIVLLVPLSLDTYRAWKHMREQQETERRIEEENRRRIAARKAAEAQAPKRVTSFATVVSARPAPRPPPRGDAPPR